MDAHEWDDRYSAQELVWGAPPNEVVVELATGLPAGRAVDLGCGEGRNALWLATRGWAVEGIDFSGVALDKARRIAAAAPAAVAERLTWTEADLTTADLGTGVDLMLVGYIHLPSDERPRLLRRTQDALAPGGALLVLGHHSRNIDEGVGGPQDPDILFTPDDITALLDEDMQVGFARELFRETSGGTAIDTLVFARKP
ncbi:class I SAM-dependent methyltransferase [Tomitella fengzijianii]|uniref:Methyltransferase domain-containing protein n=1 Tax=Tomitella fengzijianii TaxID=2597660 RepID=A0A516X5Y2_9ACTN|nr:class I SAM-dependent methyltransferase [Tomitella fengzijianii]QDQ98485.1 methyltransferase domain-containing protein [Tomitella fengzijianii]